MQYYILFAVLFIFFVTVANALLKLHKPATSQRHSLHYNRCQAIFKQLFANVNATQLSVTHRQQLNIQDSSLTYGEITFDGFATMLALVEPKSGEIFYDLGCGAGKAVFAAALLYDFADCRGVELLKPLHQLSLELREKFYSTPELSTYFPHKNFSLNFILANFLEIDFSNADVIFINATCFTGDYWIQIISHIDLLKVGTRIILTSRYLPHNRYQLLYETDFMMSWGVNSVNIYRKIAM